MIDMTIVRTRNGAYVNTHSGLCEDCSLTAAQAAVFWTDDSGCEGWTTEQRFAQLQEEMTDARARCLTNCGRDQ